MRVNKFEKSVMITYHMIQNPKSKRHGLWVSLTFKLAGVGDFDVQKSHKLTSLWVVCHFVPKPSQETVSIRSALQSDYEERKYQKNIDRI